MLVPSVYHYFNSIGGDPSALTWTLECRKLPGYGFDISKVRIRVKTTATGAKPRVWFEASPNWGPAGRNTLPIHFDRGGDTAGWYRIDIDPQDAFQVPQGIKAKKDGGSAWRQFYLPATGPERLAEFKRKYAGRKVWVFGSSAFTDGKVWVHNWDPAIPVEIADVSVKKGPGVAESNPVWDFTQTWGTYWPEAQDVLELKLKLPPRLHPWENILEPFTFENFAKPPKGDPAIEFGRVYAVDDWNMPFLVSSESPESLLRTTSPAIQAAFHRHEMAIGMPRGLVPYLLGYPTFEASLGDLARRQVWSYPGPAPFEYVVWFDKTDRVKSFGIAGELP